MGLQCHSKTSINVRLHSNSNTNSISTHRAKTWIEQTILTRTEQYTQVMHIHDKCAHNTLYPV